jgi:pimeloyl-ACP methyl ester carboxylesterase
MMKDPDRRRAVRKTLVAPRDGLDERVGRVRVPTLVMMGGADSHFDDPRAEGEQIAARTNGSLLVIPGAGHYPHAEYPEHVATAINEFIAGRTELGTSP